ncbi:MAG: hypothetical protein QNJ63_09825 [Calothrix sp. MO_192.B10]|nr:hypothetical protein [Calothrix sp. MO_192.B10]
MTNPKFQIGDSVRIKNLTGSEFTIIGRMKQPSIELSLDSCLEESSSFEIKNMSKGWLYRLNNGHSQWFHENLLESN